MKTVYALMWDDSHRGSWKVRAIFDSLDAAETHKNYLEDRLSRGWYRVPLFRIAQFQLNHDALTERVDAALSRMVIDIVNNQSRRVY